ncbi:MAG: hypothetical protein WCG74_04660 [Sediminibacterium sp.]|jgi:hypothetical protein
MGLKKIFLTLLVSSCFLLSASAQYKKVDTTMKLGKAGYRLYCNNKSVDKNNITITPVGFESGSREISFEVKGKVAKAEVDDLNNDGFPDMVIYLYTGVGNLFGNVIGIMSNSNTDMRPVIFPDIMDDPKLKIGYKGYDEFYLVEGSLMRKFPIYQTIDSTQSVPSGSVRQIQYRVVPGERESMKFKVVRSYEVKKAQ